MEADLSASNPRRPRNTVDQAELLDAARSGDREALAELYRTHAMAALGYARTLCRRREDSEDLVAEAFANIFAQLRAGGGPRLSFLAYLRTTMRNLASRRQREFPVAELPDVAVAPDHAADFDRLDDIRRLRQALHGLDPNSRQVVFLRDILGLSPADVCQRLGLHPSTAAMRYARARTRLRELYLEAEQSAPDEAGSRPMLS